MRSVLGQLRQWRFRERVICLLWGGGRWLALVGTVLAVACATDWTIDRFSGSEGWRKFLKSSWVLKPTDPLSAGETPVGLRLGMTLAQLGLAGLLAYTLLIRPWLRTPPVDDLASRAEKAFPVFDHRLVTAIQLNRATARTQGMSPVLIREVTREAEEIASRINLLSLIDYRRLGWAAAVAAPVALAWGGFYGMDPELAGILIRRQAMPWADIEIPRKIRLRNVTPEVWPSGSEVVVRFEVSGEYDANTTGVLRYVPDGQPEDYAPLTNEPNPDGTPSPFFSVKLPPASIDFSFQARIGDGRTKEPARVVFEAPPQLDTAPGKPEPLTAEQVLPVYLGRRPDGRPYFRRNDGWSRGEVIDALPGSSVIVDARFNKPVREARLIRIERSQGLQEQDLLPALTPVEISPDRTAASFEFPTTPRLIGYRLELIDDRGFVNPVPIRRNVRMWDDRPPVVEFRPESTRNPDPDQYDGSGNPKDYEWDMALGPDGVIQVIYTARSEVGIRAANIRYRVIPRGVQFDLYPEEYRKIQHPRDDPNLIVFDRLPLTRFVPPRPDPKKPDAPAVDLGPFDTDLGLFRYSFRGVPSPLRNRVNVQFYPLPSRDPEEEPGELEAGGRYNFEVAGLLKTLPDGTKSRIEVGDTVELYVEVFDKVTGPDGQYDPNRPAGYTREAKRKIVVTEAEAEIALRQRDEARQRLQDKLRDLAADQMNVFRPKKP